MDVANRYKPADPEKARGSRPNTMEFIRSFYLEAYDRNRNLLYNGLKDLGFECIKPQGAFYLFVKSPEADEKKFCENCKKYNILVVPGTSFACPGYVRISYCVSYEQIERSLPAFAKVAADYGLTK